MVRTAKYKYIKTLDSDNQEQLFDLHTDPFELKNLVDDPSMKKVIDSHRSILAKQLSKESRIIN
jgi:arylsulfatase A-like enzyme